MDGMCCVITFQINKLYKFRENKIETITENLF